jgi:AcrR family transcriptional regulator
MGKVAAQPNPHRRSLLRQERSRQTRDALVRAALGLWRKHGYNETTVDEISTAASVARSTYYFHFPDKEALLREVAATSAVTIGAAVSQATAGQSSLEEGLRVFAFELGRHVERLPRDLVSRVTLSVVAGIGHIGDELPQGSSFARQLEMIFDATAAELRPGTDRAELGAIAAGMVMEGILRWSFGGTPQTSLEDVIAERMALILNGVRRR